MVSLNLPSFEYKLKEVNGKVWIFDGIRKKYIVLTPEEWVRQHFINYLIQHLNYPKALFKVETGLSYNQLAKRSDIIVFNRQGEPWMVIECKAPHIQLDEQAARQASMYSKTLNVRYLVLTNGIKHLCFDVLQELKHLAELPEYD